MKILKNILKWLMGIAMIFAGINHFIDPAFYMKMMPPYLPWHLFLIYISGIIEVGLGILLLIPKTQKLGAWGIIALLIAVYPANIFMAMNPQNFHDIAPVFLYVRLALQLVLIAWAFWFTREE